MPHPETDVDGGGAHGGQGAEVVEEDEGEFGEERGIVPVTPEAEEDREPALEAVREEEEDVEDDDDADGAGEGDACLFGALLGDRGHVVEPWGGGRQRRAGEGRWRSRAERGGGEEEGRLRSRGKKDKYLGTTCVHGREINKIDYIRT